METHRRAQSSAKHLHGQPSEACSLNPTEILYDGPRYVRTVTALTLGSTAVTDTAVTTQQSQQHTRLQTATLRLLKPKKHNHTSGGGSSTKPNPSPELPATCRRSYLARSPDPSTAWLAGVSSHSSTLLAASLSPPPASISGCATFSAASRTLQGQHTRFTHRVAQRWMVARGARCSTRTQTHGLLYEQCWNTKFTTAQHGRDAVAFGLVICAREGSHYVGI